MMIFALAGCATRSVVDSPDAGASQSDGSDGPPTPFPLPPGTDVDILFVVDNSNDMAEQQVTLSKNFPNFIEALKTPKLAGRIPNLHIGIVSSDLGAGTYAVPSCEVTGGDRGELQAQPRLPGCYPPAQPYIAYNEGVTNIHSPTTDPLQQVTEAFSCIAELGTGGCGFEHQIEAARRALDPKLNINPGFMRAGALLVVVFLTDEDDCSAAKPQLFDPNQWQLTDPLGPLSSFRCFEFGIQCDINDRFKEGPRKSCKPAYDWLYKIQDYVTFFKGLKPPGQVLMSAIAGPAEPVEVKMAGQNPVLISSCTGHNASPAIRIKALLDSFGERGLFNRGLDATSSKEVSVDIGSHDYSPALRKLGRAILEALGQT